MSAFPLPKSIDIAVSIYDLGDATQKLGSFLGEGLGNAINYNINLYEQLYNKNSSATQPNADNFMPVGIKQN